MPMSWGGTQLKINDVRRSVVSFFSSRFGAPAATSTGSSLAGYSLVVTRSGVAGSAPLNALKA